MRARPFAFWFLAGFLAATVLALIGSAGQASAQTTADPQAKPEVGITLPDQAAKAQQASRSHLPPEVSDGGPGDTAPDDIIPRDDPSQDPTDPNSDESTDLPEGQRATVTDGDLSGSGEPGLPRDGVLDTPQARQVTDGVDATAVDLRTRDERELFENTTSQTQPAGYDPLLFQVEDLGEPSLDRRTQRLFRLEPYDPIGMRIGSFVYFPEAEISGVTTSNVLSTPKKQSDVFLEINSTSRLVSDWKVHALEFRSRNVLSFHDEFPSEDDRGWTIEGRGRLDIAKRTNLQGLVSHDVRQEGRSGIDASTTGTRPDVTTDEANATLNHRFNRLSLQLRGAITDIAYEDIRSGPFPSINSDRDSTITKQAVRATWEFKPELSVFTEVELNQRSFDKAAQGDLIKRDSTGTRTRVGLDFGETGSTLRGEIGVGVGTQTPDDDRLSDITAFLVDGSVAWRFSDLTTLLLTAQSDIFDTTTTNSAGVVSHQAGAEVRHQFRKYLVGTAGVTLTWRDYDAVPLTEDEQRYLLGAEYFLSREVVLFGRYEHTSFNSNQADSDFEDDELRLGVKVRR